MQGAPSNVEPAPYSYIPELADQEMSMTPSLGSCWKANDQEMSTPPLLLRSWITADEGNTQTRRSSPSQPVLPLPSPTPWNNDSFIAWMDEHVVSKLNELNAKMDALDTKIVAAADDNKLREVAAKMDVLNTEMQSVADDGVNRYPRKLSTATNQYSLCPPPRTSTRDSFYSNWSAEGRDSMEGDSTSADAVPPESSSDRGWTAVIGRVSTTSEATSSSQATQVSLRTARGSVILATHGINGSREKLWKFMNDADSYYKRIVLTIFLLSVVADLMITEECLVENDRLCDYGDVVAIAVEICFALELLLRFYCFPSRKHFFCDPYILIDCATVSPLVLRLVVGGVLPPETSTGWLLFCRNFLIGFVPLVRSLKLMRYFELFHLMSRAFEQAAEALPVCCYALALISVVFASLIYWVEPRGSIPTMQMSIWFVVVSLTTVGYGDMTPVSSLGRILTSALLIAGVFYMAMPLGMMGQAVMEVWADRDRLMVTKVTRERLKQFGYSADDVLAIFALFDKKQGDCLSFEEFCALVQGLRIGLKKDRVVKLFNTMDSDGSGSINKEEFLKFLYPNDYHRVVQAADRRPPRFTPQNSMLSLQSATSRASQLFRTPTYFLQANDEPEVQGSDTNGRPPSPSRSERGD